MFLEVPYGHLDIGQRNCFRADSCESYCNIIHRPFLSEIVKVPDPRAMSKTFKTNMSTKKKKLWCRDSFEKESKNNVDNNANMIKSRILITFKNARTTADNMKGK